MVKKFRTMESVITRWVDCASVTLSLFKLFLSRGGKEIRVVPVVQFNRYCVPWLMVLKWTPKAYALFSRQRTAFCLKLHTRLGRENKIVNNKPLIRSKFISTTLAISQTLIRYKKMRNEYRNPKRRKIAWRTIDLRTKDDIFETGEQSSCRINLTPRQWKSQDSCHEFVSIVTRAHRYTVSWFVTG